MSKHKGAYRREASVIGDRLVVTFNLEDARLIERLLVDYSNMAYAGQRPRLEAYQGHAMKYWDARSLATKIKTAMRR